MTKKSGFMDKNVYCVIMAGGGGARLWPRSRRSMPKQFLDIFNTGKSFLRITFERFAKIVAPEKEVQNFKKYLSDIANQY